MKALELMTLLTVSSFITAQAVFDPENDTTCHFEICHSLNKDFYYVNISSKHRITGYCEDFAYNHSEIMEDSLQFTHNKTKIESEYTCCYNIMLADDKSCEICGYRFKDAHACAPNCSWLTAFEVAQVFNENSTISLNISWSSEKTNEMSDGHIEIIGQDRCDSYMYEANLTRGALMHQVKAGCDYRVEISDNKDGTFCAKTRTVKECFQIESLDVRYGTRNSSLYVTWSVLNQSCEIVSVRIASLEIDSVAVLSEAAPVFHDRANKSAIFQIGSVIGGNYSVNFVFNTSCNCNIQISRVINIPIRGSNFYVVFLIGCFVVMVIIASNWNMIIKYGAKIKSIVLGRRYVFTLRMQENLIYEPLELGGNHEFPRERLEICKIIGQGAFGQVFMAKAYESKSAHARYTLVAVKTSGDDISDDVYNDFKAEIELFKKIGEHPNIVKLLGYCTLERPLFMIMEYVPGGDLKKYLLGLRKRWMMISTKKNRTQKFFPDDYVEPPCIMNTNPVTMATANMAPVFEPLTPPETPQSPHSPVTPLTPFITPDSPPPAAPGDSLLDHAELQRFALQIANGMSHLERLHITHRDLAARNILVGDDKQLKISDFGLSRPSAYTSLRSKRLPLRWMALEAILTHKSDSRSDVWSFGVVLWEIATLGGFPYENVVDEMVVVNLKLGRRLTRPEMCTDELFEVMVRCWDEDPARRPTFQELVRLLDVNKRRVYVDFKKIDPNYVFPPTR